MEIRELSRSELPEAAAVLGRGMRDNPLHVAAFGVDPEHRRKMLTQIFIQLLQQYQPKGAVLGALSNSRLVGVCAMVGPGRCQPSLSERLSLVPAVVSGNSLSSTLMALRWTAAWSRRDHRESHCHLGPVGVDRELQGKGVGTTLLREFCTRMDHRAQLSYLETDKSENVSFYQRFGFTVIADALVIGVRNWFMLRKASGVAT